MRKNRVEAKRAMLLFRELARRYELPLKPLSAEMVFDQSRIVFSYGSEERLDTQPLQSELARRLHSAGRAAPGRAAREAPGCAAAAACAGRSSAATATPRTRARSR